VSPRRCQEEQSQRCTCAANKESAGAYPFAEPEFPDHLKRRTGNKKHDETGRKRKPVIPFVYALSEAKFDLFSSKMKALIIVGVLRIVVPVKVVEYVHLWPKRVMTPI